jgi:hypothetical protein
MMNNLKKGIGIALDVPGQQMFMTDLAGSIYRAARRLGETSAGRCAVEEIADTENELLVGLLSLRAAHA